MPTYLEVCEDAARAGGAVLRDWMGRFGVREKGPRDLVTEADLNSQEVIERRVLAAFPDHGFLAEESTRPISPQSPYRWIVDPLDGTTNYVHKVPHFSVSVALARGKELLAGAVFDPTSEECFTAAAGEGAFLNGARLRASQVTELEQALVAVSFPARVERDSLALRNFVEVVVDAQAVRRMGSSALNLCYVAAGRFDAFWATDTKIWDVAAGALLVQEAGGVISHLDGGAFDLDRPQFISAATGQLHAELRRRLKSQAGP